MGTYRNIKGAWKWLFGVLWTVGLIIGLTHVFSIRVYGYGAEEYSYYYLVLALFVAPVFILVPPRKGASLDTVPWYDILFYLLSFGCFFYFSMNGLRILQQGWEWKAPTSATVVAAVTALLVLEGMRRAGGRPLFVVGLFFMLFPLFTGYLPGLLKGYAFPFTTAMNYHIMGREAIVGIAIQVGARIVLGYMLFGTALVACGGGKFFLDVATLVLGRTRGGPAKVAVLASGLFGSMSGSPVTNVITTGSITIPTMKRIGYPPHYAAAIEAVSSTGGAFMPPVMGAVAFIMASFLGVPYLTVVAAAVIPAIAYFAAILIQVDAFAARTGLPGLKAEELPSLRHTLAEGWHIIVAFLVLVYVLIILRLEVYAPWYATGLLLVLTMLRTRFDVKLLGDLIIDTGKLLAVLFAICAGIGYIIGALAMTGVGVVFPYELVKLAGGNIALLIALGAIASIILGMGMTTVAVYVFLAITLAPALIAVGFDPLATHLFVFIFGELSCITPPVALAAIVGAGIAGADPNKTGFQAVRFGIVAYLVPFFFLLNPALILHGTVMEILQACITLFVGVFLMSGALGGYLLKLGRLGKIHRILLFVSGFLMQMPGIVTDIIGASAAVLVIVVTLLLQRSISSGPMQSGENIV